MDPIVDESRDGDKGEANYRARLHAHRFLLVGLDVLSTLPKLESAHAAIVRLDGAWQAARVHRRRRSDLIVDGTARSDGRARAIRDAFNV